MTIDLTTHPSHSPFTRLRRFLQPAKAQPADRRDVVTGLMHRDQFVDEGGALVARAVREVREVAVVSVLVDDIDVLESRYSESERNHVLAVFASQLIKETSTKDIIGRVGLAEFVWVSLIESRNDAWRYLANARAETDAALAADPATTDTGYRFGFTLSRGRDIDLTQLIEEARQRRVLGATAAVAS